MATKKPAKVPARTTGAAPRTAPTHQRVMILTNGRRRAWIWREVDQ